ncbi:thiamine phosphate synthase [Orrella daihaiensis]|uniref:Thiamine-phosphate synthase n=1 Tax=Orrella daihaiensis TaxID=2782176 RepID=A0ABY4AJE3_9BURK|nr:thiamine phosphate synthase [Orrella daihaiensis]UOD50198.1 thiamine phosphate synthase [Orrella daihaiensis]
MKQALRFPSGLYGVTPDWHDADRLEQAIRQAAAGGMTAVQLRLKEVTPTQRRAIAQHLLPVCRDLQVPLIMNDDWQLAIELGADGVHLGKDDADPAQVRSQLPPSMLLGVSCYSDLDRARQMLAVGVDYIAFGAMFSSGTKPQASRAQLTILTQAQALVKSMAPRPAVVAIGGITADNAASVLAAGADSLAVVGGLFITDDITNTAHRFNTLWPTV